MAKNTIADLDTTAGNNTDILGQSTQGTAAVSTIDTMIQNALGMLARFYADMGGTGTVGGTADAITLTTASTYQALEVGLFVGFKAGGTNTGAATINVDGLGAKAIRRRGDTALQAGDILDDGVYLLRYDADYNSLAGAWVLLNPEVSTSITFATNAQALAASSTTLSVNPANLASLFQNINNNAFEIADLKGVRLNMSGGIADAYDSETDVDTATSTNETYDAANDLYSPSTSGGAAISGATGTNIGNMTSGAGLAAAFDGVTNTDANGGSAAILAATNTGYVGKTYSPARPIGRAVVYGSNNVGYVSNTNPSVTLELYGKTGAAPSSATNGTLLGSVTFTDTANESGNPRTITSSDTTTSYDHVWVRVTQAGSAENMYLTELTLYDPTTINNMTLASNAFTATAVPTQARVAVFIDPQESITINTDFTAEVSRDAGTTYTAVTLALVSNPVGTVEQYEGTVSVSSQPSGSSMKYRLKTLNNKDIDVTGTVFQWG